MADYGVQVGKVAFVGLLSAILTTAVVMGLTALYGWQVARMERAAGGQGPPARLENQLAAQRIRLTDYWIVDPAKDVVGIPIGQAMDLVVEEYSRDGARGTAPADAPRAKGEAR